MGSWELWEIEPNPIHPTNPKNHGSDNCYDIVKANGGELKVETKEARPDDPVGRGEGSIFIMILNS